MQEHLIAGASDGRNITHQADALEPMTRIGEQDVHDRGRTRIYIHIYIYTHTHTHTHAYIPGANDQNR